LYFLNFFNAESRGKRPLHPLVSITPERERQNRDIPESKASFVAYKVKNDLQECQSHNRCSLILHHLSIHLMRHDVSIHLSLAGKSNSYLDDF